MVWGCCDRIRRGGGAARQPPGARVFVCAVNSVGIDRTKNGLTSGNTRIQRDPNCDKFSK